jgi:hypothetical protein
VPTMSLHLNTSSTNFLGSNFGADARLEIRPILRYLQKFFCRGSAAKKSHPESLERQPETLKTLYHKQQQLITITDFMVI